MMCACWVNTNNGEWSELMHRWMKGGWIVLSPTPPIFWLYFSLMVKMVVLIIHDDRHPKIKIH